MKITKSKLEQIIKEELEAVINEFFWPTKKTDKDIEDLTHSPEGAMRSWDEVMPADHPQVLNGMCEEGELVTDCMKKFS